MDVCGRCKFGEGLDVEHVKICPRTVYHKFDFIGAALSSISNELESQNLGSARVKVGELLVRVCKYQDEYEGTAEKNAELEEE
jgi:hypothetical protein